jgi:anti-anti-sigma factor
VSFELHATILNEKLVLEVLGDVDMATAPELEASIISVDDSVRRVIVDLTEVTFLDSSALNALVRSQRELAQRDVVFRVVSPADQAIRRVFEITQLTGPLGVVDSRAEAGG